MKRATKIEQTADSIDENAMCGVIAVKNVNQNVVAKNVKKNTSRKALGDIGNTVLNEVSLAGNSGNKQVVIPEQKADKITEVSEDTKGPVTRSKKQEQQSKEETPEGEIVCELDRPNRYSAVHAAPYALHITEHMKSQESIYLINPNFMEKQQDVSNRMRAILVDWLVEVHHRFKLRQQTLFLAVNYLDRFIEKKQISRNKLQLLGTTCLWLASKYEEVFQPEIHDFEFITDMACQREDLLDMEIVVLNALDFVICAPTASRFLDRYLQVADVEAKSMTYYMAQFFVECTLGDLQFTKWKPSQIAAATVYLAKKACKVTPTWTEKLQKHTGYDQMGDIRKPAKELCNIINSMQTSQYQAVRIKYASEKYRCASKELIPGPVPECSTAGRNRKSK